MAIGLENVPARQNGAIAEITEIAVERVNCIRDAVERLRFIRARLLGLEDEKNSGEQGPQTEVVRTEVESLAHSLEVMRSVLEELLTEVSQLERL